jgi:hypothetical protein
MILKQTTRWVCSLMVLMLFLSACNLVRPSDLISIPSANIPTSAPANIHPTGGSTPSGSSTATTDLASTGDMQVRFVNLTDGGSVPGSLNQDGSPLVMVQFEVTGSAPVLVTLSVNGVPAVDSLGHTLQASNGTGVVPFTAEIPWSPANGGGQYSLVIQAMNNEKQFAEASIQVTVTGIPVFTATPPPLDRAGAQQRISELILQDFGVSIPKPSVYRHDAPRDPRFSRWIGSAYYKGTRYYIDLYDDTRYAWSNSEYSDPAHLLNTTSFVLCRPSGTFRVLTVFVDYGNTGIDRTAALADVPVVVNWLNGLYTQFAQTQGQSTPFMTVVADAAYISPPPSPGEFLTSNQVLSLTGKDPTAYDFLMQIDLDANGTLVNRVFSNVIESGGGVALQGCGQPGKFGNVNIWSSISVSTDLEGELVMDFNHELSHLFGMLDNWPAILGVPGPNGSIIDDWIPYVVFGWTDSDGDGIPEIIDPTPYGTSGP